MLNDVTKEETTSLDPLLRSLNPNFRNINKKRQRGKNSTKEKTGM